ncbi:MAG TPA: diaminopimelate decarboxylase [Hellea balneolensis]|uniref:Diaminopimelate decarboxylase n=1 Tax=Hellea balneolensis TaxID=287478 RepID=A0A7C3CBX6_9PROT|nr:diaminopimelate decarboxylase [Hellea balneolensis]
MNHFQYKNGQLYAEDVPLSRIAQDVGTPVYVYSTATFTRHFNAYIEAVKNLDHLLAYSVKANSNLAVLTLLAKLGAGADVVSGGELVRALRAGIDPQKIVFSGVGKTEDEMRAALDVGIYQFNVESVSELLALSRVATDMGRTAPVALRINPDVDAGGHEKISTGKAENKFGIDIRLAREAYDKIRDLPGVEVQGVDMHIGSQIVDLPPFERAMDKILDLVKTLRADGHKIQNYDLGGGLGISYDNTNNAPPLPSAYGEMVARKIKGHDLKVIFEPGRSIAGNAGVLLSKIQYIKSGGARTFMILDAAMNDLIRPALYGAHHDVEPVIPPSPNAQSVDYDIVGPVCETGDTFATLRPLPEMHENDLVIIRSAGAYGAVQSCEYNTRPLVPEELVSEDRYAVIRIRPRLEDMLKRENIPDWI